MSESDEIELHHKALTIARIYFQGHLKSPEATAYLAKREIDAATARKFELGYAPGDWRGLVDHFSSHRVRLAAKDAGLLTTVGTSNRLLDFFRERLIFPIRNHQGDLVGYGGRLCVEKDGSPKYMNTPETRLFQKGQILYGLHQHAATIKTRREAILVEGYLDVTRLSASGFDFAAAPMGTALTADQITQLLQLGVQRIWMCLDGDKAGREAANRNIDAIMMHYHPSLEVMLVHLPDGHDPDSLIRTQGPEAFVECMSKAVTLADHIHALCSNGFSPTPCLEDKALYLLRLESYIERAGGFLQHRLIDQASAYTGLPPGQISGGRTQRQLNESIAQWNPLVALAARWLAYDEDRQRIAQYMSKLTATAMGLDELVGMAKSIVEGKEPNNTLSQFAHAHGPLEPDEFDHLYANWRPWIKQAQLEDSLTRLAKMPYDEGAKKSIRAMLR